MYIIHTNDNRLVVTNNVITKSFFTSLKLKGVELPDDFEDLDVDLIDGDYVVIESSLPSVS